MSQQQYILNRLPIGLVMMDRDYRVTSFSETASNILGLERLLGNLGKTIQSTHNESSHSKIEWLLAQSRSEKTSGYASMLINVPDMILQLRISQLQDANGISGYCLILYDITELTSPPPPADHTPEEMVAVRRLLKIPVSMHGRIALLDIEEVISLHAEGHYTQVSSAGVQYFCNMSLSQLESRLPPEQFQRVHRSYIINIAHATAVVRDDDQFVIIMAGNVEGKIPVSRGHLPRLRELLGV
jgi:DNA-binding LytR/AlgR family response regulator